MEEILTQDLLLAAGDFLSIYLFSYMDRTFYKKKKWAEENGALYFMVFLFNFFMLFIANLLELPPVNLVAGIAAFMIPLFVCFEVNNLRGLAYYAFYLVGTLVLEILLGVFIGGYSTDMGMTTNYEILTPEISVCMNLLELVLVLGICKFGNKDRDARYDRVTMGFTIIPVVSAAFIIYDIVMLSIGKTTAFDPLAFGRNAIGLLIINILVFVILEKYTEIMKRDMQLAEEKLKLQSDADIMGIAARSMRERLEISEKVMQQDRVMRHDRRHFEALMLSLINDGKIDEAKKCLEERLAIEPRAAVRYCENTTVNAAISHYVNWARKEEIQVDVLANIPAQINTDEMELSITISNLLENAVHACQKLPVAERRIRLLAKYKHQLLLEVENTYRPDLLKLDDDGYPCTSEQGHGVGTRSILAFVNKTGSEIQYIPGDETFKVRMIVNA